MSGENVYQMLQRIVANWDGIPIRVFQDGHWQSLYLSEIRDDAEVAKAVVRWLNSTYIKESENDGID